MTPEVLYCAKKAGVTHVLKAGGAQAVAAMAWGTETCPKVMSPIRGLTNFSQRARELDPGAGLCLKRCTAACAFSLPEGESCM